METPSGHCRVMVPFIAGWGSPSKTVPEAVGIRSQAHLHLYLVRHCYQLFFKIKPNNKMSLLVTIDDKLWVLDSNGAVHQLLTSSPLKNDENKRPQEILRLDEDWVLL